MQVCACIGCPEHDGSCPELTPGRRCPRCAGVYERRRGTRQERGYDTDYDQQRKRWEPLVATGRVPCHADACLEPNGRRILPDQAWDLGHDGQRRIRGPEHARCNRSAGGKAAHTA